jgi:acetyl esterase
VIGSVETHDVQVRDLCRCANAVVVSVEYRLAPEDPWPAAVEDCLAATDWALERYGRVAVGGDSAGGNLAAVVAQQRRDRIAAQLLIYPATDFVDEDGETYSSRRENAEGYFLTEADLRFFEGHYAVDAPDRRDPLLSPIHGDLDGLPPAVVVTAEFDPLRDEGDAYANAMRNAGVRVEHRRYDGLIHGFFGFGLASQACDRAAVETCELFAALL